MEQDTGLTAPDTLYVLAFGLLQDGFAPQPGSALRAEIYDGTNLLGGGPFTVPFPADEWQVFALDAISPHVPAGDLTIKFTGVTGACWLDGVSLTASSLPAQVTLTNGSFENQTANPWYVVPAGGMPASFGWSNNLAAGSYVLANQYSANFSAAADGPQALMLYQGASMAQDAGAADSNSVYRLSCSICCRANILPDPRRRNPGGIVRRCESSCQRPTLAVPRP